MKIYPKKDGYQASEILQGMHWLDTDLECKDCGKVQSAAQSGSVDYGRCGKCGGRMV